MKAMAKPCRSKCPISLSLELFGDRWSLLILRDLIFFGTRHYRQFLDSPEGIATNVLADRLKRLEAADIISRKKDPDDGKRFLYTVTPKGLDLLPVLMEIIVWGTKYEPTSTTPGNFLETYQRDPAAVIANIRSQHGTA